MRFSPFNTIGLNFRQPYNETWGALLKGSVSSSLVSEKEAISEERHCDYIQKAIAKLDSLLLPLQYMKTSHGQLGTSNLWTWT